MFWTKEKVQKFMKDNPIDTKCALNSYKPLVKWDVDDGDVVHKVLYPVWSPNDSVVRGVFNAVQNALKIGEVDIYLRDLPGDTYYKGIEIVFWEHACTPS